MNKDNKTTTYSTSQIAKIVGLHPNTVRMYEEWGLIQTPERKKNGYRVYDENDMNRLKIIRSLRCANYSLSSILRMLNKLESEHKNASDMFDLLNTPDEDENTVSACDRLVVSLENAIENAYSVIDILKQIKHMKK